MERINYSEIQKTIKQYYPYDFNLKKSLIDDELHGKIKDILICDPQKFDYIFCKGLASIKDEDLYGLTALHWAIHEGLLEKIKLLFSKCVPPDQLWLITSEAPAIYPVHLSIAAGNEEVFKYILSSSKNSLYEYNPIGTPLHIAIRSNQPQILTHIMGTLKKNIKKFIDLMGGTRETPLQLAAFLGHLQCALILIRQGLQIDKGYLEDKGTAIFYAAMGRQPDMIRVLYYLGADLNAPDNQGMTAKYRLTLACDLSPLALQCSNIITNLSSQNRITETCHPTRQIFPPINLVLSGTWDEQPILAGVIQYLVDEKLLFNIKRIGASSISSLAAALLATGSTPSQMKEHLHNITQFLDKTDHQQEQSFRLDGTRLLNWIEKLISKNTGVQNLTFKKFNELIIGHPDKYKELYLSLNKMKETHNQSICLIDASNPQWNNIIISHAVYAAIIPESLIPPHPIQCFDGLRIYLEGHTFSSIQSEDLNPIFTLFDQLKYQNCDAFGNKTNRRTLIIEAIYQDHHFPNQEEVNLQNLSKKELIYFEERRSSSYSNSYSDIHSPWLTIHKEGQNLEELFHQGKTDTKKYFNQSLIDLKNFDSFDASIISSNSSSEEWKWKYDIFLKPSPCKAVFEEAQTKTSSPKTPLQSDQEYHIISPRIDEAVDSTYLPSKVPSLVQQNFYLDTNCSLLPKTPAFYLDREALYGKIDQLINNFPEYPRKIAKIALVGFEGIGKTTAIVEYAKNRKKILPLTETYVLQASKLPLIDQEILVNIEQKLAILSQWILIIDGLNTPNDSWLQDFETTVLTSLNYKNTSRNPPHQGAVFFTSRMTDDDLWEEYSILRLNPFSEEETTKLFKNAKKSVNAQSLIHLKDHFAYFPNILQKSIENTKEMNLKMDSLLEKPDTFKNLLNSAQMDIFQLGSHYSPILKSIITHFSLLGHDSIPYDIFDTEFFNINFMDYKEIHQLFQSHILQKSQDIDEEEGGYNKIHPLLQAKVRYQIQQDAQKGYTATAKQLFKKNIEALYSKILKEPESHDASLAKKHLTFLLEKIAPQFPDTLLKTILIKVGDSVTKELNVTDFTLLYNKKINKDIHHSPIAK